MTAAPAELKACCAAAYGSPAARWLLGPRLHPGGAELTARLIGALGVGPGDTVADVACGPGESSLQLARETGCRVVGVDLSTEALQEARRAAEAAGLGSAVEFLEGDAEALPLADASVDGVLCECAFCTFPDKEAAAAELARVLRPGGRVALSDVTAERGRLPAGLATLAGWVACLGGAEPADRVADLVRGAGLAVTAVERHDDALGRLLDRVEARLRLAGLAVADPAAVGRGLELVGTARRCLADGVLGYAVVVAARPVETPAARMRRGASNVA